MKTLRCVDCQIPISVGAKRCIPCAYRKQYGVTDYEEFLKETPRELLERLIEKCEGTIS